MPKRSSTRLGAVGDEGDDGNERQRRDDARGIQPHLAIRGTRRFGRGFGRCFIPFDLYIFKAALPLPPLLLD